MAITRFFTTACTITTPSTTEADSTTDAEGVPTVDTSETETVCHLQPYGTTASDQGDLLQLGRDEVRRARRAWFPAGTDVRFTSTITIGTDRFDIAGDPDTWSVGSTGDHVACVLVRHLSPGESAP